MKSDINFDDSQNSMHIISGKLECDNVIMTHKPIYKSKFIYAFPLFFFFFFGFTHIWKCWAQETKKKRVKQCTVAQFGSSFMHKLQHISKFVGSKRLIVPTLCFLLIISDVKVLLISWLSFGWTKACRQSFLF